MGSGSGDCVARGAEGAEGGARGVWALGTMGKPAGLGGHGGFGGPAGLGAKEGGQGLASWGAKGGSLAEESGKNVSVFWHSLPVQALYGVMKYFRYCNG